MSWETIPYLGHKYPAVGSYVMSAELKAEFTNGPVTSKLTAAIDITY
jgi:hypothetical protein